MFIFLDNENLTFRGNSIATKAMEAYIKIIGEKVPNVMIESFYNSSYVLPPA